MEYLILGIIVLTAILIFGGRKLKSVRRVPDSKMSTYNYMPAVKHNLPYQRRNF